MFLPFKEEQVAGPEFLNIKKSKRYYEDKEI